MGVREKVSADVCAWRLSKAIYNKARARNGNGRGHLGEPSACAPWYAAYMKGMRGGQCFKIKAQAQSISGFTRQNRACCSKD